MPRSKTPSKHLPNKSLSRWQVEINQNGWQAVRDQIIAAYEQRCLALEEKHQQPADQLHLRGRGSTKLTHLEKEALPLCYLYRLKAAHHSDADDRTALKAIASEEMQLLRRGYSEEYISKNLLGAYHNLLRTAIERGEIRLNNRNSLETEYYDYQADKTQAYRQHYSLIFLALSDRYHHQQRLEREQRLTEQMGDLQPVQLQPYLEKTQQLLQSDDPYDLAVGIAAATGRRFSEVLARGHFRIPDEVGNPYQLLFSGQLKTDEDKPYLVHSVVPAAIVVEAHARLRDHPKLAVLNGDEQEATIWQINTFNSAINGRCQRHYEKSEIVAPLPIDQHISLHSLRRAYAAIATHLHCPTNVDPAQFAAQNLGHEAMGNATKHYLCYYVVDSEAAQTDVPTQIARETQIAATTYPDAETEQASYTPTDESETDTLTFTAVEDGAAAQLQEASTETVTAVATDEGQTDVPTQTATPTQTELATAAAMDVETDALRTTPTQIPLTQTAATTDVTDTETADTLETDASEEISIVLSGAYQQQLSAIGSRLGLPQTEPQQLFEALMDLLTLKLDEFADVVCGATSPPSVQQQIDQLKAMQLHLQQQVWRLQVPEAIPSDSFANASGPMGFVQRRSRKAHPVDFSVMPSEDLKKSTRKGSATEKLRRALKAMERHNDQARERSQKWHINQGCLKNLTGCFVPSIRSFMDDRAQEIAEHNKKHELDEGVNKAHGQMGERVEQVIQW